MGLGYDIRASGLNAACLRHDCEDVQGAIGSARGWLDASTRIRELSQLESLVHELAHVAVLDVKAWVPLKHVTFPGTELSLSHLSVDDRNNNEVVTAACTYRVMRRVCALSDLQDMIIDSMLRNLQGDLDPGVQARAAHRARFFELVPQQAAAARRILTYLEQEDVLRRKRKPSVARRKRRKHTRGS